MTRSASPQVLFITSTYLGDAIISTTALEWLKERYPEAEITIACGEIAAPIFEAVPNLKKLHIIRKQKGGLHSLKLAWAVCRQKWECVLDIRGTGIGYFLRCKKHILWKSKKNISETRIQQITELLGLTQAKACKIYLKQSHREAAKALLPADRPILFFSPLASWDKKCWPAEYFLELSRELTKPQGLLAHAAVAFLGDAKQRTKLIQLLEHLPLEQRVDLSGNIELLVLAACLEHASLFVGNDSGLMHLAAAMGAPTLGLFGPSRPEVYAPFGARTSYVQAPLPYESMMERAQAGENLMQLIPVNQVVKACHSLIESKNHDA